MAQEKSNGKGRVFNKWEQQYDWMAEELEMSVYELKAFCCHECLDKKQQLSYDHFKECHSMIKQMIIEAMEDQRTVVMTVRIAFKSRMYARLRKYLQEKNYAQYEDSHFMPLSFEFAIEKAMGVEYPSTVTIMNLLKKRW